MQRIERYGVIALVFLLVTILAVSLWGDGRPSLKTSEPVAEARPRSGARADAPVSRTAPIESRRARDRALPTSQAPIDPGSPQAPSSPAPEESAESLSTALDHAEAVAQVEARRARRALGASAGEAAPGVAPETSVSSVEALPPTVYVPPSAAAAPRRASSSSNAGSAGAPASVSTVKTVIVASGETLSQIAQRELGSSKRWPEIAACNGGLDPTKLRRGMILKLPPRGGSAPATSLAAASPPSAIAPSAQPRAQPAAAARQRSYVVRAGDVLSQIAQRELGSSKRWKEIVALNPGLDPERLIVGARLVLPASSAVAAPAKSPPKSPAQSTGAVAQASAPAAQAGWSVPASGSKVR